MAFREDDVTVIKKRAEDLEKYLKRKADRALDESAKIVKNAVENAIKSVKDAESSVEEFVDDVTSWPYKVIYEAERAIKHLYGLDQFY